LLNQPVVASAYIQCNRKQIIRLQSEEFEVVAAAVHGLWSDVVDIGSSYSYGEAVGGHCATVGHCRSSCVSQQWYQPNFEVSWQHLFTRCSLSDIFATCHLGCSLQMF